MAFPLHRVLQQMLGEPRPEVSLVHNVLLHQGL